MSHYSHEEKKLIPSVKTEKSDPPLKEHRFFAAQTIRDGSDLLLSLDPILDSVRQAVHKAVLDQISQYEPPEQNSSLFPYFDTGCSILSD
jgi:hypothetical protein